MPNLSKSTVALGLGFLAALATLALTAVMAANDDRPLLEVRIAAMRQADGDTEFAAQVRTPGGDWGERLQPRLRVLRANVERERWYSSSEPELWSDASDFLFADEPDEEQSSTTADFAGEIVVRIAAKYLTDGRIEFGLQERAEGGGWGQRLRPRSRYFPVGATVGRWLVSSRVTVGSDVPQAVNAPATTEEEEERNETASMVAELHDQLLSLRSDAFCADVLRPAAGIIKCEQVESEIRRFSDALPRSWELPSAGTTCRSALQKLRDAAREYASAARWYQEALRRWPGGFTEYQRLAVEAFEAGDEISDSIWDDRIRCWAGE